MELYYNNPYPSLDQGWCLKLVSFPSLAFGIVKQTCKCEGSLMEDAFVLQNFVIWIWALCESVEFLLYYGC